MKLDSKLSDKLAVKAQFKICSGCLGPCSGCGSYCHNNGWSDNLKKKK